MNILIANDDGIQAEGIRRLAKALSEKGDVYVVAPDRQRSASSHALSLHDPLHMVEVEDFDEAKRAWKISGTPADCVKLGVDVLRRKGIEIDVVYSGINHGANLGTDTMYSGTVSSAAEGVFLGLPAVAVSVCDHYPDYFEGACSLAVKVFEHALETKGQGRLISVNAPNLPLAELRGVKVAKLGEVKYHDWFDELEEDTYSYAGAPIVEADLPADVDVRLIREGYATVSIIKYDLNDYEGLAAAAAWDLQL